MEKAFHLNGVSNRLYFTNYERKSENEEFEEIVSVLKKNGCKLGKPYIGPDCDLIEGYYGDVEFTIVRAIDDDGSFLYCDSSEGMRCLEKMFKD